MRGDTLPDMEDFDRAGGDARPQLFLQQMIGHRVIMLVDRDVVIEPGAALLPFREDIRCQRRRLQGGLVQLLEQLSAAGPEMARDFVVELVEQRSDRRVHILKAEELSIAQPRRRTRGAPRNQLARFQRDIQRSTSRTAPSTFALSLGLCGRAGTTAVS